jgi:hypothetical protein
MRRLGPWAFQIPCTVDTATPASLAIARDVQYATSFAADAVLFVEDFLVLMAAAGLRQ